MSAAEHEATCSKAEDSEDRVMREVRRLRWHVIAVVYIVGLIVYTAADRAAGGPTILSLIVVALLVLLSASAAWLGRSR